MTTNNRAHAHDDTVMNTGRASIEAAEKAVDRDRVNVTAL